MAKKKAEKIIEGPVEPEMVSEPQAELTLPELDLSQEIENLQQDLASAQAKSSEYLDGWQRSRAEFANYKKRVEREQAEAYQRAAGAIIKRYLDVHDDLELALKNRPSDGDGAVWANGIDLIYRKISNILEGEGVKPLAIEGELFDPNFHEAISMEPNPEFQNGQIIEVLKQGYLLGDKIIRPALVRVAQ